MRKDITTIPYPVVKLIIGYLHNSLTDEQKDELDEWINESDDNMKLFCDLTDGVSDTIFDPEQLLIETDEAIDLWIIAGLIVRRQQGLNNEIEKKYLEDWVNADERNRELFRQLQHPAFMQKMLVWARLQSTLN